jgi:hypothetical protein
MFMRMMALGSVLVLWGCAPERAGVPHQEAAGEDPRPSPAVMSGASEAGAAADRPADRARSFASFRPSRHGFRFVNSFTGSPLPLEGWTKELGVPERFGLCGGMSCAAADLYIAGVEVPGGTTPPERGAALYDYIYQRQVSTFALGAMAMKFIEWMEAPEEGERGTHARTAEELPQILAALDEGRPVVLGLVFVARTSGGAQRKAWENHQVLAYAAERLPMGVVELRIYDPNFPGADDAVIRYVPSPDGVRIARIVPGRGRKAVRGFFAMPYTPVRPPSLAGG